MKKPFTSHFSLSTFQAGFTLIEILVTVSIMALLSSVLILYNRSSESQLVLFKEQAKIINTVLRAKSLALNTYGSNGTPCSYGIHFGKDQNNKWEFRIFQDLDANATNADCSTADNKYSGSSEDLNPPVVEKLSSNLEFTEPLGFTDAVFIPPDPTTIITPAPSGNEATLEIVALKGPSRRIKMNSFGQVSAN